MNKLWSLALVAGGLVLLGGAASTQADPLTENLKRLQERAKAAKAARQAPPARPRPVRRAPRRVKPAPKRPPMAVKPSPAPVVYGGERIGGKARTGDLIVSCTSNGPVHVYVEMRLVSNDGNGTARVPDLAPKKIPVLVFNPESGKRKTFYVPIKANTVTTLNTRL